MLKRIAIATIGLFLLLFGYYQIWFLRLPDRDIPQDPKVFVSPANGVVSAVVPWDSTVIDIPKHGRVLQMLTSDVGEAGWMISIEMDVTNVHYQRAPYDGRYIRSNYVPGQFKNALIKNNEYGIRLENEHNSMLFEINDSTRYKVVQVAGLVARRIVDMTEGNTSYERGDIIGLIKLGSQVSLIIPNGITPVVKEGDVLIDGESIVAKLE